MGKEVRYRAGVVLVFALLAVSSFMLGRISVGGSEAAGIVFSCDPTVLQTLAIPKEPAIAALASAKVVSTTGNYFASKNGEHFYPAGCASAQNRIKPENLIWFQTQEEATLQGFTRSNSC